MGLLYLVSFVLIKSDLAQTEPIESVVNRYQTYVTALTSNKKSSRIWAMNDFAAHILRGGYRGLPPTLDQTTPEWVNAPPDSPEREVTELYRQIVEGARRSAKSGSRAEYLAAFRLACSSPDLRRGDVWAIDFGDVITPELERFDDGLAMQIAKLHPDWATTLMDDSRDVIAANAFFALPAERTKTRIVEWGYSPRPVRRSISMSARVIERSSGYPKLNLSVATHFLSDGSMDLRWQTLNMIINLWPRVTESKSSGLGGVFAALKPRFHSASPELKWSLLAMATLIGAHELVPKARGLRHTRNAELRAQALMLLSEKGDRITDGELRFAYQHSCYFLQDRWLPEVEKRPGLKDLAKEIAANQGRPGK